MRSAIDPISVRYAESIAPLAPARLAGEHILARAAVARAVTFRAAAEVRTGILPGANALSYATLRDFGIGDRFEAWSPATGMRHLAAAPEALTGVVSFGRATPVAPVSVTVAAALAAVPAKPAADARAAVRNVPETDVLRPDPAVRSGVTVLAPTLAGAPTLHYPPVEYSTVRHPAPAVIPASADGFRSTAALRGLPRPALRSLVPGGAVSVPGVAGIAGSPRSRTTSPQSVWPHPDRPEHPLQASLAGAARLRHTQSLRPPERPPQHPPSVAPVSGAVLRPQDGLLPLSSFEPADQAFGIQSQSGAPAEFVEDPGFDMSVRPAPLQFGAALFVAPVPAHSASRPVAPAFGETAPAPSPTAFAWDVMTGLPSGPSLTACSIRATRPLHAARISSSDRGSMMRGPETVTALPSSPPATRTLRLAARIRRHFKQTGPALTYPSPVNCPVTAIPLLQTPATPSQAAAALAGAGPRVRDRKVTPMQPRTPARGAAPVLRLRRTEPCAPVRHTVELLDRSATPVLHPVPLAAIAAANSKYLEARRA